MSNNFRVAGVIAGKKRRILFRKHIQLARATDIRIHDRVIHYVGKANIPAPVVIPTKEKEKSFFLDGNYYTVYEFIPGDHFRGTKKELVSVAESIALLHRAFLAIPFRDAIRRKKKLLLPWTKHPWQLIFKHASQNKTPIDRILLAKRELIFSSMKAAEERKKAGLKRQVIHGDLHPQNTIFEGDKLKAFLDFENVTWAERMRDVANAMHRFVRQYAVYQGGSAKEHLTDGVSAFLGAYERITPLREDEKKAASALITDELLRKLSKDVSRHYFSGESGFLSGGELEKKLLLLEEVKCLPAI